MSAPTTCPTTESVPETFANAVECLRNTADRLRTGGASRSEIDGADVLLIGLRRLLADWRAKETENETHEH